MFATLEKVELATGKPIKLIFTTTDAEARSLTLNQVQMMEESPVDLYFHLRLTADDTQLPLLDTGDAAADVLPVYINEDQATLTIAETGDALAVDGEITPFFGAFITRCADGAQPVAVPDIATTSSLDEIIPAVQEWADSNGFTLRDGGDVSEDQAA